MRKFVLFAVVMSGSVLSVGCEDKKDTPKKGTTSVQKPEVRVAANSALVPGGANRAERQ